MLRPPTLFSMCCKSEGEIRFYGHKERDGSEPSRKSYLARSVADENTAQVDAKDQ